MVLPNNDRPVLASYLNSHGKLRWIIAEYIRQFTVESEGDDDEGCTEYNDDDDTYYRAEGWYERIENWGEYASIVVHEGTIDYWQNLKKDIVPMSDGAPPDDHVD